MKVVNIDQNSEQWLELRKGKITGSKLKDIVVEKRVLATHCGQVIN